MSKTIVHTSADTTTPSRITITGRVFVQNGNPAPGLTVNARERGLRGGNVVATAQTGRLGEYLVAIDVTRLTLAAGGKPAIQLEVADAAGTALGRSQILFDLRDTNAVDIMLRTAEYTGVAEFDGLMANVRTLLAGVDVTALNQDDKQQDYDFLAGTLGRESNDIRILAESSRFAAQTGIPAGVFYAVMRHGGPTTLHGILSLDRDALRAKLERAVAGKIVTADTVGPFSLLAARFDQQVVRSVLTEQPDGVAASVGTILGLAIPDSRLAEQFLTSYQAWDGDLAGFWKQMAAQGKPLDAATLTRTQRAIQLGGITGYHPQMTAALIALVGTTGVPTLRDLARWTEGDWTAFIGQVGQQNKIVAVPPVIPGDGDAARTANYATTLARVLADAFPTTAFSGRIARDRRPPFKAPGDVRAFLDANPDFDFARHPVYTLLDKSSPFTLTGVTNQAAFLADMKSAQRLFKLSPDYAHVRALMADGLDSAARVIEIPKDAFIAKYSAPLGGDHKAEAFYKKASGAYMLSAHLYAKMNPQLGFSPGVIPSAGPQSIADPTLATMFGSLDSCGCDDCQSLYSPSAYFTDILAFLQKNAPPVFSELTRRRPDLVAIELTCANTNTPLPYVDLVNERLESLILSRLTPAIAAPASYQTQGTAEELAANPEHTYKDPADHTYKSFDQVTSAYDVLRTAVYPAPVPFHLPLEEARTYFSHLGIARAALMETFFPLNPANDPAHPVWPAGSNGPTELLLSAEQLGLSQQETDIITAATAGQPGSATPGPWNFYGVDKSDAFAPIADPADSQHTITGNWVAVLAGRVDVFLQQTGLVYRDLLKLLETDFVNPAVNGVRAIAIVSTDPGDPGTCVLSKLALQGLDATALGKVHRVIRLWRRLGWTLFQIDKAIRALGGGALDAVTLVKIAATGRLMSALGLDVEPVLAFFSPIDSARYLDVDAEEGDTIPSLYDTLFRNKAVLNPPDTAFGLDPSTLSGTLSAHTDAQLAAIQVTSADYALLVDVNAGIVTGDVLSLGNLSALYRHATLARALNLSLRDYLTFVALLGVDPFASVEAMLAFVDSAQRQAAGVFSIAQLDYLLRHEILPNTAVAPTVSAIALFLTRLRTDLAKVLPKVTDGMTPQEIDDANQAADTARRNLVKHTFSETLTISPAASSDLLGTLVKSLASPAAASIEEFVDPAFIDSTLTIAESGAVANQSVALPNLFQLYRQLHKIALFLSTFAIADEELDFFLEPPADLGLLDLAALPLTFTANANDPAYQKLADLVRARDLLPFGTPAIPEIVATAVSPAPSKQAWLDAVGQRTQWGDALALLVGDAATLSSGGVLQTSFPADFQGGALLLRLRECMSALKRVGMTATQVAAALRADLAPADATQVKNAAKARHSDQEWLTIAKDLRDPLREQQRAALVAWVTAHPDTSHHQVWNDADELYEYLLIDVQMAPCMMTSRTKQAMSSAQLFIDRVLLNLEHPNMDPLQPALTLSTDLATQWDEWRKMYRIWEANRKIFLYPENWLEPDLRDDPSPFFEELQTQLAQNELTTDNVEDALIAYLEKLDSVARLEIVALYHEVDDDAGIDTLHVVGRSYGLPHNYWYRRRSEGEFTAWEKMDVDVEGEHLSLLVWDRRLHLFWLHFEEKTEDTDVTLPATNKAMPKARRYYQIQAAYSQLKQNAWSGRSMSKRSIVSASATTDADLDDIRRGIFVYHTLMNDELYVVLVDDSQSPFGYFHYHDHHSDPTVGDSVDITAAVTPPGETHLSDMQFAEDQGANTLYRDDNIYYKSVFTKVFDGTQWIEVVKTVYPSPPVLAKTGRGQFRLVAPGNFSRYPLEGDFFFQDRVNTFYVYPQIEYRYGDIVQDNGASIGKADDIWKIYYQPPVQKPDPIGPLVNPALSMPFEVIGGLSQPQVLSGAGRLPAPQMKIEARRTARGSLDTAIEPSIPMKATGLSFEYNDSTVFQKEPQFSTGGILRSRYRSVELLKFETHFHHHVRDFLKALEVDGVDGFMVRALQSDADTMNFVGKYSPQSIVDTPYPDNTVDFDFGAGYSCYNWELFFHVPMLIASRLHRDQRFEDAQRWYHYIFDPTNTDGTDKARFWQFKPFYDEAQQPIQTLQDLLADAATLQQQVAKWEENPFEPHVIARMRISAYMKNVVMKYVDNLIAWGDQLFGRDTIEAINEATNLYVLAAQILGRRPDDVPARAIPAVQTYDDLDAALDPLSNALVDIETFLPPSAPSGGAGNGNPLGTIAYFCVSRNDNLLAYWDTVADRLFKIRHCMNIEGVVRQLPLFEPPIDPALLVQAAAAGMDLASILNDISAPLPSYRFAVLMQRAQEFVADVKALGQSLLSALEKRDGEALQLLRQTHEMALAAAVREVRTLQVREAKTNLEALQKTRAVTELKFSYYSSRPFLNTFEQQHLSSLQLGLVLQAVQGEMDTIASALFVIPEIKVGSPTTMGASFGGSNLGQMLKAISTAIGVGVAVNNIQGTMASTLGGYDRRRDDWKFQADTAKAELAQIDRQIAASEVRQAIAEHELANQNLQIEHAKELHAFMTGKFTNRDLYDWMIGQIATVYFQAYQLAYDLAKKAERCYRHELGIPVTSFIQFGYWDSLRKGLMAGEKLQYDLRRMDASFLDQNRRELELTKHVSLAILDPKRILDLRRTGTCTVSLPEELFDLDYQGHYFRRIRNVSLSLPCVAGPYTTVSCTLRLLANRYRVNTTSGNVPNDPYAWAGPNDPRFRAESTPQTSMATSTGQNDSGMFELNFRDDRYLPFEGSGAISTWQIDLTDDPRLRQFDYETITDVILHVRYTAREDAGPFRAGAQAHLKKVLDGGVQNSQMPLSRFFSARHEFPSEWYRFFHPASAADDQVLAMQIGADRFPFFAQDRTLVVDNIQLFARVTAANDYTAVLTDANALAVHFTLNAGNSYFAAPDVNNPVNTFAAGDVSLTMRKASAQDDKSLPEAEVEDLILLVAYHLK
jgi:receptor-binding and translocation channel-forming TcA subunit of Tc toxin/ABC toxin-like protein/neuraminidase-like protein